MITDRSVRQMAQTACVCEDNSNNLLKMYWEVDTHSSTRAVLRLVRPIN